MPTTDFGHLMSPPHYALGLKGSGAARRQSTAAVPPQTYECPSDTNCRRASLVPGYGASLDGSLMSGPMASPTRDSDLEGAPAALQNQRRRLSISVAAQCYNARASVAELPETAAAAKGQHTASGMCRRMSKSITTDALDSVIAYVRGPLQSPDGALDMNGFFVGLHEHGSPHLASIDAVRRSFSVNDAILSPGSDAVLPPHPPSRFAAAFKHTVNGLSGKNEAQLGSSLPAGGSGSRTLTIPAGRPLAGTPATQLPSRLPNMTEAHCPRPPVAAKVLEPRQPLLPTRAFDLKSSSGDEDDDDAAAYSQLAFEWLMRAPPLAKLGGDTAAVGAAMEDEGSASLSISWDALQRGLAIRAVEEQEQHMYVPSADASQDGPALPAHRRHILVKKPVLLGNSFLDDDNDDDDDDHDNEDHDNEGPDDISVIGSWGNLRSS